MVITNAAARVIDTIHQDPYEMIETVGRLCYKSEDKMTEDSAVKFVTAMYKSNHHAMLEHYHVMLSMSPATFFSLIKVINDADEYMHTNLRRYLNITCRELTHTVTMCYMSSSFRGFIDVLKVIGCTGVGHALGSTLNNKFPELFPDYQFDPEIDDVDSISIIDWDNFKELIEDEMWLNEKEKEVILSKHIPITAIFRCDRGVSHELVRHRPASFGQESTRYCNYSNDKFKHSITFIKPCFFENNSYQYNVWENACTESEKAYFTLIDLGATPQEARSVLHTSVKTEIGVTATEEEWQHIINLRHHGTTGKPHPQMLEVMEFVYPDICKLSEGRIK